MSSLRAGPIWHKAAARAACCAGMMVALTAMPAPGQQAVGAAGWHSVSLKDYQQHLGQLDGLAANCQAQRSLKSQAMPKDDACDPERVGPDDRVSGATAGDAQPREARYDWLRTVLARAGNKETAQPNLVAPLADMKKPNPPPSVDTLLAEARARLQADERQAMQPAPAGPDYATERQTLSKILAQKAYQGVGKMSARERFAEWFFNEFDRLLASLVRFGSRSRWIVWTLRILLLLALGTGLAWALFRMERRSYAKLIPDVELAPGAPSAREWQLWLKDAREMAAQKRWRDAIHFLYWASIARLESRRLWPADRARTPREYLGLLPESDPRKAGLAALTRSFERTWYGGRDAAAADFKIALELAAALGVAE